MRFWQGGRHTHPVSNSDLIPGPSTLTPLLVLRSSSAQTLGWRYRHRKGFHMRTKIALAAYLLIGFVDLVLGVIYVSSNQFLSYHSQAVGAAWEDMGAGTQTLILALMKLAGGGWLALGFVTIAFAWAGLKGNNTLARWALPIGTVIFWSASLSATWSVFRQTGAQTPWVPSLVVMGVTLVALLIDAPWSSRRPDTA